MSGQDIEQSVLLKDTMEDFSGIIRCPDCYCEMGYFEGSLQGFEAECSNCGLTLFPANAEVIQE